MYGCAGARNSSEAGETSTTSPAYMTTMLVQKSATTPKSWDTNKTAIPISCWSDRKRSSSSAWTVTSSALVGSSAMRSLGEPVSASAIATRWAIPPESW